MNTDQSLGRLAERYGIAASYWDFSAHEYCTSPDTQRTMLQANSVAVDNDAMVREALTDAEDSERSGLREVIIHSNTHNLLSNSGLTGPSVTLLTELQALPSTMRQSGRCITDTTD